MLVHIAGVAELADALDLESVAFGRGGSTPSARINGYDCIPCHTSYDVYTVTSGSIIIGTEPDLKSGRR